jgi:hypothetical protein
MMMLDDVNGFGHLSPRIIQTSAQVPFRRDDRDTR